MSKRKLDAKAFAQQKRKRRQWITFMRMCRYGVNNFSRNAWLTIAATAVMTITLLVIFMTVAARNVLLDTVGEIRSKVDMSIYVKTDVSDKDVQKIGDDLRKLSTVTNVRYVSPQEAREEFAKKNKTEPSALDALNEATNKFPGTFRVSLTDINNTSELDTFVKTSDTFKKNQDPSNKPSFAGERRSAIQNIGRWVGFAEKVGLGASIVFVFISSMIVFNTIRMAIFNRKEEIQMMKLIGADRSFIRGPFVVEAVVYGFIAAILATIFGAIILYSSAKGLLSYEVAVQPTIDFMTTYIAFVLLAMVLLGAVIGVISSLLATRKYLKI
ncbi:MAG TPA: permease-like cell division protein FtsX [Candidatus Saccharimonadales bacterium]|nr:permease-like cell division protein FtsX [Candidatus Saccharimonadales bacterium]